MMLVDGSTAEQRINGHGRWTPCYSALEKLTRAVTIYLYIVILINQKGNYHYWTPLYYISYNLQYWCLYVPVSVKVNLYRLSWPKMKLFSECTESRVTLAMLMKSRLLQYIMVHVKPAYRQICLSAWLPIVNAAYLLDCLSSSLPIVKPAYRQACLSSSLPIV